MTMKKIYLFKNLAAFVFFLGFYGVCSQTITTAAGTGSAGFSGDGGPATAASINAIYGQMATDNAGNIYFTDQFNNRIRRIDISTGTITTVAGTGTFGFTGDGGPAISAQFYNPCGIAINTAGDIYIADTYNYRIRRISSGTITTICGNGSATSTGDGGLATAATINSPGHLYIDAVGNIFITEFYGNRVRKIATTGSITTICGDGSNSNSGDGGLATAAKIGVPWAITGDAGGNIYLASYLSPYVRKIATNGTITAFAGISGSPGFSGDGGSANVAQLGSVTGLGSNNAGDIFIADSLNHRIRRVAASGTITTLAGIGTAGFGGDGGSAISATLGAPNGGIAVKGCTLYFIDAANARIRKIVGTTPTITAVSSTTNYICVGGSATLTASGASYYNWNPGGGGTTIAISPTVTTSYTVVGTGTNGCQSSAVLNQSVSPCTSITELILFNGTPAVKLYPNPSSGEVTMEVEEGDMLKIIDAMGKKIMEVEVHRGNAEFNMIDAPAGIYFVQVLSGKKVMSVQKLVKE